MKPSSRTGVHSPPHQLSLGQQVGMPIGLVNIHLPTEHDEAADLLQFRPPGTGLKGVKGDEWYGGLRQRPCGDPEGVVAIIPNAKDRFHRVR